MRSMAFATALLVAGCAVAPAAEVAQVAAKGELRVAIAVGAAPSAFWAVKDASDAPRGVTVDLGRAAAAKLGVPLKLIEYRNAGEITAAAAKDEWDLSFMPHEAEREKLLDHGPAYVNYDSTYIVRAGLEARTPEELDRKGIQVGAISGTSTSRTAARQLRNAAVVLIPRADEAVARFIGGEVDALAMGREALDDIARKVPGSRVLSAPIQQTAVVVIVPKGRVAARVWATNFLEGAKRDGTVRKALDNAGFKSAQVAPASGG